LGAALSTAGRGDGAVGQLGLLGQRGGAHGLADGGIGLGLGVLLVQPEPHDLRSATEVRGDRPSSLAMADERGASRDAE